MFCKVCSNPNYSMIPWSHYKKNRFFFLSCYSKNEFIFSSRIINREIEVISHLPWKHYHLGNDKWKMFNNMQKYCMTVQWRWSLCFHDREILLFVWIVRKITFRIVYFLFTWLQYSICFYYCGRKIYFIS